MTSLPLYYEITKPSYYDVTNLYYDVTNLYYGIPNPATIMSLTH